MDTADPGATQARALFAPREEPDEGLDPTEAWRSLVRGGWTISEHLLAGPTRRLAAQRTSAASARESLSPEMIHVAAERALGKAIKVLAWELGSSSA